MISNTSCKLSGHVVRTCLTSTQFFSIFSSRTAQPQNKVTSFSVNNKTFVRIKTKYKTKMTDEWLKIGTYSVFPWSISGVETCVVIKTNGPTLTFDLGYSCRSSVSSNLVFFRYSICTWIITSVTWVCIKLVLNSGSSTFSNQTKDQYVHCWCQFQPYIKSGTFYSNASIESPWLRLHN